MSKRRLIILDLNGFLVHRVHECDTRQLDKHLLKTAERGGPFFIWTRPHAAAFLEFLFQHFTVAVWTSARPHNANLMLDALLKDTTLKKSQFLFVWGQDKCKSVTADPLEKDDPLKEESPLKKRKKYLFTKPLARVWEVFPDFDETNTLLIDDSPEKAVDNPPGLHYCPDTWSADTKEDTGLKHDSALVTWLTQLHTFSGPVGTFTTRGQE